MEQNQIRLFLERGNHPSIKKWQNQSVYCTLHMQLQAFSFLCIHRFNPACGATVSSIMFGEPHLGFTLFLGFCSVILCCSLHLRLRPNLISSYVAVKHVQWHQIIKCTFITISMICCTYREADIKCNNVQMTKEKENVHQKNKALLFFPVMTCRWTVGTESNNRCQLCISIAFQRATLKVRENGWTPPLIPGTLGGIIANTRTRTSVISLLLHLFF